MCVTAAGAFAQPTSSVPCVGWPATDALNRSLPAPEEVRKPRADRFVGIFYFLWLNERGNKRAGSDAPLDVSEIFTQDPGAMNKPRSPLWGTVGRSHYWGQPLFGYYLSTDPWVIRRHAHMLADAGIDTLIFDATNALTYREQYMQLCKVYAEIRKAGNRTPQFAFMVNSDAGKTAEQLYKDLYQPGLYTELWFQWEGKPLMICDPAAASPEVKAFFTLRAAHWPFTLVNTQNAWHWETTYPQVYGYTSDPKKPEQVNVSVAQNLRARDGKVTNMSNFDARGRSFHDGKTDTSPGAVNFGHNFQEQWERAMELDPPFVMVTGWNEWIAGRWGDPNGRPVFVDQFTEEYSRDIEPMVGGHGDNYYYQLVSNVRRFKGAAPIASASGPITINIDGSFDQWRDVAPEFLDHRDDTLPRDFDGAGSLHYTNRTGRNDFVECKVARDDAKLYFYARTAHPITARTDANWMWLLIDADQNPATGWEGYDYVINRTMDADGSSWLEKNTGGWNWTKVAKVKYQVAGNEIQIAVPRSSLPLLAHAAPLSLDFKWADNLQHPGDIMDFYQSGDVAPDGRFMYRYFAK